MSALYTFVSFLYFRSFTSNLLSFIFDLFCLRTRFFAPEDERSLVTNALHSFLCCFYALPLHNREVGILASSRRELVFGFGTHTIFSKATFHILTCSSTLSAVLSASLDWLEERHEPKKYNF